MKTLFFLSECVLQNIHRKWEIIFYNNLKSSARMIKTPFMFDNGSKILILCDKNICIWVLWGRNFVWWKHLYFKIFLPLFHIEWWKQMLSAPKSSVWVMKNVFL